MIRALMHSLIAVFYAALLAGCGASEPGGPNDLTAAWFFAFTPSSGSAFLANGDTDLSQSGTLVTGDATVFCVHGTGCSLATFGPVLGSVSGADVTLTMPTTCSGVASTSALQMTGTLTANGFNMGGNYTLAASACNNAEEGTWGAGRPF